MEKEIYNVCKKINDIIIDILNDNTKKLVNKLELNEDIISLIRHISNEIEDIYNLCMNGHIVSAMILLRSTFENMMFIMNILHNPELSEKYKKIKNNIQPRELKNEIIQNWDTYFSDIMENENQTRQEIKEIYGILSKFVHTNCIRTTAGMMEKDKDRISVIKYLYMQNITSVILIYIDFIDKYLKQEKNELIYSIVFYEWLALFMYIGINKEKIQELEKYNEYVYLYNNQKEFENYKNIMEKDIKEIGNIEKNSWKIIIEHIEEIINMSQYKENIQLLNEDIINLIKNLMK